MSEPFGTAERLGGWELDMVCGRRIKRLSATVTDDGLAVRHDDIEGVGTLPGDRTQFRPDVIGDALDLRGVKDGGAFQKLVEGSFVAAFGLIPLLDAFENTIMVPRSPLRTCQPFAWAWRYEHQRGSSLNRTA